MLSTKREHIRSAFSESRYATPSNDHSIPGNHTRQRRRKSAIHGLSHTPCLAALAGGSHSSANAVDTLFARTCRSDYAQAVDRVRETALELHHLSADEDTCSRSHVLPISADATATVAQSVEGAMTCTGAARTNHTVHPSHGAVRSMPDAVYHSLRNVTGRRNVLLPDWGEPEKHTPCQRGPGLYNFDLFKVLSEHHLLKATSTCKASQCALRRRQRALELAYVPHFVYRLPDDSPTCAHHTSTTPGKTLIGSAPVRSLSRRDTSAEESTQQQQQQQHDNKNSSALLDTVQTPSTRCPPLSSCEHASVVGVTQPGIRSCAKTNECADCAPQPVLPLSLCTLSSANRVVMRRCCYPVRSYNDCRNYTTAPSSSSRAATKQKYLTERERWLNRCRKEDVQLVHNLPQ